MRRSNKICEQCAIMTTFGTRYGYACLYQAQVPGYTRAYGTRYELYWRQSLSISKLLTFNVVSTFMANSFIQRRKALRVGEDFALRSAHSLCFSLFFASICNLLQEYAQAFLLANREGIVMTTMQVEKRTNSTLANRLQMSILPVTLNNHRRT